MSECILCSGNIITDNSDFEIVSPDSFLMEGRKYLGDNNLWSFTYRNREIDTIITDAQIQLQQGVPFEETEIYYILNTLMASSVSFAMWYDMFFDSMDRCYDKNELLEVCRKQIIDESGMCEVYILYLAVDD